MALIIVESPTKARTFNRILKDQGYYVFATLGHIRDLPHNKLAIDYSQNFKPDYKIIAQKKKVVDQLKNLLKKNKEIILATDLDREGESISYHVAYLLGFAKEKWPEIGLKNVSDHLLKRIVFHEITASALKDALGHPEELRLDLVKAQQARRILDRIVGYELSPLLWKKMGKNWLSAGRVQTVALRLIVEREKEIAAFKQEKYYQIIGDFKDGEEIQARLVKKNDQEYQQEIIIKLFAGDYKYVKTSIDEQNLQELLKDLRSDSYKVEEVREEVVPRYPPPPYTTSLLQQDAFNRFGFPAKMVMRIAQSLYERGLITYHRTDSFNLSAAYVFKAKDYITTTYGQEYALEKPRGFKSRARNVQEAHEAIRPTRVENSPEVVEKAKKLNANQRKIYSLIFYRALATQMKEAQIKQIKISIRGTKGYLFESDFQQVIFDGFLKVLNPNFVANHQNALSIKKNTALTLLKLEEQEKLTTPPPRYTEASLIKILEEWGIGRPSTYASIISLIQDKGYSEREGRSLKPTSLGAAISDYLSVAFPKIFDLKFTASMEEGLDEIAEGKLELTKLLKDFYSPFKEELEEKKSDKTRIEVKEEVAENCPKCGSPLTLKLSRFGKFYACTAYPKCKFTKPFLKFAEGKICPKDGGRVVIRYSRKGRRFFGCENYPNCDYIEFSYLKLTNLKKEK